MTLAWPSVVTRSKRRDAFESALLFLLPLSVVIVLVQREVETARFPLASITPFSESQFGKTAPNALRVMERAVETATGFKKK
jgi:hypothetical protein